MLMIVVMVVVVVVVVVVLVVVLVEVMVILLVVAMVLLGGDDNRGRYAIPVLGVLIINKDTGTRGYPRWVGDVPLFRLRSLL
jgi:hypothetical protein